VAIARRARDKEKAAQLINIIINKEK
jgi:hypothetical protein